MAKSNSQQGTGDHRDPQQYAGRVGVNTGPVPLERWQRDNPFKSSSPRARVGEAQPGTDLHPERRSPRKKGG